MNNVVKATAAGFDFSDFHLVEISGETHETTENVLDENKKLTIKVVKAPITPDKAKAEIQDYIVNCVKDHGAKPKLKTSGIIGCVEGVLMNLFGWNEIYKVHCFILNNKALLAPMIENAAVDYFNSDKKKQLATKKDKTISSWNIPQSEPYNKNTHIKKEYKKYVFTDCWLKKVSTVEDKFQDYLESHKEVKWWWKNRDSGSNGFAIKYLKNNEPERFLLDYIVMFNDGTMGFFDTKGGQTAEAKEKAEALFNCIRDNNVDKISYIGGIVIDHNGFKINTSQNYTYVPTNLGGDWEDINNYLKKMLN